MTDTRLSNDVPDHSDETHASTTIRTSTLSKIQPDVSRLGFTDLPPELRLMIYRHAFPEDEIHIVVYGNTTRAHPYHEQTSSLLHLNRQITQEIDAICTYIVHVHVDVFVDQQIQNHRVSKSQEICKLLVQANRNFTVRIELEDWEYPDLRDLLKSLPGCKVEIKAHVDDYTFEILLRFMGIWKRSGMVEASVTVVHCQEQGMKCCEHLWRV
ncbi:hypothetical protein D6C98_06009 [Aureobasidium pullulans]|uniref:2EXR domain-containing protein n=2 Tax=Aureobasidium pullulans TaxID=5580 RepID=A0A4S9WWU8_AURPU|nr:hypothetical protein D6D24_10169 [Aureobasidium pullulans]THW82530.1 hypothetical protein D6D18_08386 [Aureobasidium pullulans]THY50415.1 hypothetical protein D6C98_06009 [Aureobasidium pullulans]THZ70638.1 hypothetical protein D6C85_05811 [Aureobasidium pullulans]THZ99888.1 hypothetical protein D6C82_04866 [Aureobasidium pullulans]